MAGRRAKKHEHVNHERWLVSYADFITLLFAFFVVMFAVSQVDSKKMGRFVESVSSAFQIKGVFPENQGSPLQRGGGSGRAIVPLVVAERPTFLPNRAPTRQNKTIRESLQQRLDEAGVTQGVELRYDPRGVALSLSEAAWFHPGTATFRAEAGDALHVLAAALADETAPVQIEAHTAGAQLASSTFPSNWELSAARAAHLAAFLASEGRIDPRRLSATGLAEHHPLSADAHAGGQNDGRVDLVLITSTGLE